MRFRSQFLCVLLLTLSVAFSASAFDVEPLPEGSALPDWRDEARKRSAEETEDFAMPSPIAKPYEPVVNMKQFREGENVVGFQADIVTPYSGKEEKIHMYNGNYFYSETRKDSRGEVIMGEKSEAKIGYHNQDGEPVYMETSECTDNLRLENGECVYSGTRNFTLSELSKIHEAEERRKRDKERVRE